MLQGRIGRRGLAPLAAAAGAWLLKPSAGRGAPGQPVLLGEVNIANRETVLSSGSPDLSTLRVSTGSRVGILATNGDAIDFGEVEAALVAISSKGDALIAGALEASGRAIQARGRVAFSGAGVVEIPASAASWTIYDVEVPEQAIILAQLQGYGGPGVGVRYCVRLTPTSFRVQLSAVTTTTVRMGYFIFESASRLPAETMK